jgi:nucleoid factor 1
MAQQQLFKEFIVLFKSWPIDLTKSGRCLGEHIRKEFSKDFRHGEFSQNIDVNHWKKVLNDLKPLANNEILNKYPRNKIVGALGLGRDQCKLVVSNQAMKIFNETNEDK